MQTQHLSLLARTPVHVGAGNSVGAVDSPVMRERHTRVPIIPGSSLKGVLRDLWYGEDKAADRHWLFGNEQNADKENFQAGALLIGEARVLAFPVRSARNAFAWTTCPLALRRYARDAGVSLDIPDITSEDVCYASPGLVMDDKVVLEEYCLSVAGTPDVAGALADLSDDPVWKDLDKRLVILHDEMFAYFVEHACEVVTRVRIDDDSGTVSEGALFNQENVPSETLFYAVIAAQDTRRNGQLEAGKSASDALVRLKAGLRETGGVIQVGGDETVGLGYCSAKLVAEGKED